MEGSRSSIQSHQQNRPCKQGGEHQVTRRKEKTQLSNNGDTKDNASPERPHFARLHPDSSERQRGSEPHSVLQWHSRGLTTRQLVGSRQPLNRDHAQKQTSRLALKKKKKQKLPHSPIIAFQCISLHYPVSFLYFKFPFIGQFQCQRETQTWGLSKHPLKICSVQKHYGRSTGTS